MDQLVALGAAAVDRAVLEQMVADQWGVPDATVLEVTVETVDYDLDAITTAARHWVRGSGTAGGEAREFAFFVKHVQSWSRSPLFQQVPAEVKEVAAASVPWRTEPLVYRSDLDSRLPEGLSMPTCRGVFDLDELSAALWLDVVQPDPVDWDDAVYARAARAIGRLAASPRTRELAGVGGQPAGPLEYLAGRVEHQVVPMLMADEPWAHPLVAGAFDHSLRDRLRACAARAGEIAGELAALPERAAHGDSSPNNLMPVGEGFVLIDYGFWSPQPVGFDLAQLVLGETQLGRFPVDRLPDLDALCLASYVEGLREEGDDTPEPVVARGHALKSLLYTGLSSVPWEHLGSPPSEELAELARARAAIATYAMDRADATAG